MDGTELNQEPLGGYLVTGYGGLARDWEVKESISVVTLTMEKGQLVKRLDLIGHWGYPGALSSAQV